ncbi:MAG: cytosine deaminase [Phycisphaerae bacterium]
MLTAPAEPASRADVLIVDGAFARLGPRLTAPRGARVIDAAGGLVSPAFVESHVHLDSALTDRGRCLNQSGTLFEGIEIWRALKAKLTLRDVKERVRRALDMQLKQGVLYVRTHADVSEEKLVALRALLELREEVRDRMTLQIVAFPQDGLYGGPAQLERMEEALRMGADAVGGIPHYELTREDGVASVHKVFELATRYDRMIDVHCDEVDDPQSRFLEVMAACAIRAGNGPRVTASHTTAFGSYDNAYAAKLMRFLDRAKIHFVANPLINIVLQGRTDNYPTRRGLTRVKELWQAGLNVSLGYDCLMDPWYALGTGNMLDAAHMAVHACHMMGRAEIDACYDMVTFGGARTLDLPPQAYGIAPGREANCVILPVADRFDAIRTRPAPTRVIARGRLL